MADKISLLDEVGTKRPARTAEYTRAVDPNDVDRIADSRAERNKAQAELDRLERSQAANPESSILADRVAEATKNVERLSKAHDKLLKSVRTFTITLKSVPPHISEQLSLAHPPTSKQRADAKKLNNGNPKAQPHVNPDTYPAAVIAEGWVSMVDSSGKADPVTEVTAEQVADMMRDWSDLDQMALYSTVETLSKAPTAVEDLGKG